MGGSYALKRRAVCSMWSEYTPGSYKLETIIENACFLGTYEVPRDYMEEQLKLYYDDNQFHIPEKIVFKLYII